MKRLLNIVAFATIIMFTMLSLQSCLEADGENPNYASDTGNYKFVVVTIKTDATGQTYMQLNDSSTIVPSNPSMVPDCGKEVRAFGSVYAYDDIDAAGEHTAVVTALDTIRTKMMQLPANDGTTFGDDPLEIVDDWMTVCEDGYLTLHFRTYFGNGIRHNLCLIPEDDNTVRLCHNANGDTSGDTADGLIAFRLNLLPSTGGKYKEITMKWASFAGEKSVTFKYKSRD